MLSQIWIRKRRYNDFDKMHKRLLNDLEYRAADNLPELPPKRMFFNKEAEFVRERLKLLNKYLKFLILIYEAIENPIMQRFLEIDTRFNPGYEYDSIDVEKNLDRRSDSECSSLFLEMDKYMKTRFRHVLKGQSGPAQDKVTATQQSIFADLANNRERLASVQGEFDRQYAGLLADETPQNIINSG